VHAMSSSSQGTSAAATAPVTFTVTFIMQEHQCRAPLSQPQIHSQSCGVTSMHRCNTGYGNPHLLASNRRKTALPCNTGSHTLMCRLPWTPDKVGDAADVCWQHQP
jgi:hypothetical protein